MKRQRGIALLEAMIACIILAIGLIGTIVLQARAQVALASADMRAEATIASEKLVGLMSNNQGVDQANLDGYKKTAAGAAPAVMAAWHTQLQSRMPGSTVEVAVALDSPGLTRVVVTIRWQRRSQDNEDRHVLTSYISAS